MPSPEEVAAHVREEMAKALAEIERVHPEAAAYLREHVREISPGVWTYTGEPDKVKLIPPGIFASH